VNNKICDISHEISKHGGITMKKIISTILAILTLCTMVMAKPFTTATVSDYKESQTLIEQENNTGALQ
jgi:hypothetical protein